MTIPNQLQGSKCADSDDGDDNVEIETCMTKTAKECTLQDGEVGAQKIGLKNARRHIVDAKLTCSSVNDQVKFGTGNNCSTNHEREVSIGPSVGKQWGTLPLDIDVEKTSQGIITEEPLTITLSYDIQDSQVGSRSGPTANPSVELE